MVSAVKRDIEQNFLRDPADAAADFGKDEDGSLTIFGLVILGLMMVGAGIALDIMRSEVERTEYQYAIDRAVLAAADVDQSRDGETVVRDYIRAAGLDPDKVTIESIQTGQSSNVSVTSDTEVNSLFMDLLGVPQLTQPVSSIAREDRTPVELSLVLDVSGSMGGAKIEALRTAASDFVGELLRGREDLTTISLVPYNDRVNAGSLLNGVFPTTDEHSYSNCFVFEDADFNRTDLPVGDVLQRMGHFDFRSSHLVVQNNRVVFDANGNRVRNDGPGLVANPNCRTDEKSAVLPWSNNIAELQDRISQLDAQAFTAMDLGVKWGALLLDPSSRGALQQLSNDPDVSDEERVEPQFVGRPFAYNEPGVHKLMVLMTDGVNTQQWDLKSNRKSGPSDVYIYRECLLGSEELCEEPVEPEVADEQSDENGVVTASFGTRGQACLNPDNPAAQDACLALFDDPQDDRFALRYSVWDPRVGAFWVDHLNGYFTDRFGGDDAVRLDWARVFASLSIRHIVNNIMAGANFQSRVDMFYSFETTHDTDPNTPNSDPDVNLSRICSQLRDQGVVIYTIAFQAPPQGQRAMRDCAGNGSLGSNDNFRARYFEVENLDIDSAFDDVLASVTRLRLVRE